MKRKKRQKTVAPKGKPRIFPELVMNSSLPIPREFSAELKALRNHYLSKTPEERSDWIKKVLVL